ASLSAESRRTSQIIGQGTVCGAGITTVVGVGTFPCFGGFTGTGFNQAASSLAPNVGSINGSGVTGAASTAGTGEGYGGWKVPDVVANLRVDQAWGSAAIAGAAHQVNAAYYLNGQSNFQFPEGSGHPDDKWGWAGMVGVRINTPFIGTGDYLQAQAIYTRGALRYIFFNPSNNNWWIQNGFDTAYGVVADGVYGGTNFFTQTGVNTALNNTGTGINLTTAWGLNASYEPALENFALRRLYLGQL